MYPLLLCSVLALTVILYRLFRVRKQHIVPDAMQEAVEDYLAGKIDAESLLANARNADNTLARLIKAVISAEQSATVETLRAQVRAAAKEEFVRLQNGIPLLDMVVTIAPMFGILGTASGLVVVFGVFGGENAATDITSGIARALNTTIIGLAVATPAVVASVVFSRALERHASRLETLMLALIQKHAK